MAREQKSMEFDGGRFPWKKGGSFPPRLIVFNESSLKTPPGSLAGEELGPGNVSI
jgi:hypothetical protein